MTPVTLTVDPKGYFLYWTDQNKVRLHTNSSLEAKMKYKAGSTSLKFTKLQYIAVYAPLSPDSFKIIPLAITPRSFEMLASNCHNAMRHMIQAVPLGLRAYACLIGQRSGRTNVFAVPPAYYSLSPLCLESFMCHPCCLIGMNEGFSTVPVLF